MAAPMRTSTDVPCEDFMGFQEGLKKMRLIDDRITNALNTSVPTISFSNKVDGTKQCKHLYEQLNASYDDREQRIKHCLKVTSEKVEELRKQKQLHGDDLQVAKLLRKEQTKLRLMQGELGVEGIIRERSLKLFYERCRDYYKPTSSKAPL
ncbi:unnamed protein product [Owenia fusiformis]|uniref:Protein MIX23 n=1 Tax=Owenia fusiformis TaxID=6347 RepID=A0A8J1TB30_OWEFU|nr:unnamed protein product [Owenia fusiformis]